MDNGSIILRPNTDIFKKSEYNYNNLKHKISCISATFCLLDGEARLTINDGTEILMKENEKIEIK